MSHRPGLGLSKQATRKDILKGALPIKEEKRTAWYPRHHPGPLDLTWALRGKQMSQVRVGERQEPGPAGRGWKTPFGPEPARSAGACSEVSQKGAAFLRLQASRPPTQLPGLAMTFGKVQQSPREDARRGRVPSATSFVPRGLGAAVQLPGSGGR